MTGEMPAYPQVMRKSRSETPFSNSTEFEAWADGWCLRSGAYCRHDSMQRGGDIACPLLDVAMLEERTPAEWGRRRSALGPEAFECSRYEPE